MNARSKHVLEELLTWPEEQRAELASELVASIDSVADERVMAEDVEAAWMEEIERRARRVLSGEAVTYDSDESMDRIEAKLRLVGR